MAFERYEDRVCLSVYNSNARKVEERSFYVEDDSQGMSVDRQAMEVAKYWCESCECAFGPETDGEKCPICGDELESFEPDVIRPFLEDVVPEYFENDDGFAIDELPCYKE